MSFKLLCGVGLCVASLLFPGTPVQAALYTDDFSVSHDYLANGVAGTIWDGLYTGAGSFPGGNIGSGPGSTLSANANITSAGMLTVQSVDGFWDGAQDDGFFLFKNVAGDFQMSVQIVTPFSASPFNTGGLMARAAAPDGSPLNGTENSVSISKFDQFGFGTYIRNTANGTTTPNTVPPDNNYWVRLDRVNGTNFNFYTRELATDPWQLVANSTVSRPDFSGLNLQVGIEQGTAGAAGQVQFENFSLTTIAVPEPAPWALFGAALVARVVWPRRRGGR
jgi:hypothetical protein